MIFTSKERYTTWRWYLNSDGVSVRCPGVDWGPKSIQIVAQEYDMLVVKIPGGSHWTGNYMPRAYHASKYVVLGILSEGNDDNGYFIDTVQLTEVDVRAAAQAYKRVPDAS